MMCAFLLAVWGIFMGGLFSSWAVMLDGVFNLISAVMTLFSLMITRMISDNRETRDFPLGYYAFESFFVLVKQLRRMAKEVYADTQTEFILERL